jgi:hypothetical protein
MKERARNRTGHMKRKLQNSMVEMVVVEAEGPTLHDVYVYHCCGGSLLFLYTANRNTNLSTKLKQQHGAADCTTFVSETATFDMDGRQAMDKAE